MSRPSAEELLRHAEEGSLEERARADMRSFCFRVDRRQGRDKAWFGEWSVTINRNTTFSFFTSDVRDDPGLEPFPVIRAERTEERDIRVRPDLEDPTGDYVVHAFYLAAPDYRVAVESMTRIHGEYGNVRLLADAWFAEENIVKLVTDRLLRPPAVQAERESDWPQLLH